MIQLSKLWPTCSQIPIKKILHGKKLRLVFILYLFNYFMFLHFDIPNWRHLRGLYKNFWGTVTSCKIIFVFVFVLFCFSCHHLPPFRRLQWRVLFLSFCCKVVTTPNSTKFTGKPGIFSSTSLLPVSSSKNSILYWIFKLNLFFVCFSKPWVNQNLWKYEITKPTICFNYTCL